MPGSRRSKSATRPPLWFRVAQVAFFSVFLIGGCLFFYVGIVKSVLWKISTHDWLELPCTIVFADTQGWEPTVRIIVYTYEVDGEQYRSDRYRRPGPGIEGHYALWESHDAFREIVRRYRKGSKQICHVNPDDPSQAILVLSSFDQTAVAFGVFGSLFVLIGAVALKRVLVLDKEKPPPSTTSRGNDSEYDMGLHNMLDHMDDFD